MAAARRSVNVFAHREKSKKKRPGVNAKSKKSKLKSSKNYSKKYRGQGR